MAKAKAENIDPCPICGGPGRINAKVCAACHTWWYYHSLQTSNEFGLYVGKVRKATIRIEHKGQRVVAHRRKSA